MRAYNTTLSQYVDWVVNDTPDSTGTFSGYPIGQLIDITVNRVVQSKVGNIVKNSHGLGGSDGYYVHVNSYDWKNATSPIPVPPSGQLSGLAVERGITSLTTVNGATNASPIQVSTVGTHGLTTGQYVTIIGVQGNFAANGTFPIINTGTNSFTLTGSAGNGAYTSGGTVFVPTDFSTLTWDETNQIWRFAFNTKGDGTTLGASQDIRANNTKFDGYTVLGTNPASQGIIRLPNNQFIFGRNQGNSADIQIVGIDNLNRIKVGGSPSDLVYMPGNLDVDGYIVHDGSSTNVPTTGFIREQNGTNIVAIRNAGGTADIVVLSSTSGNLIVLGDSVNSGINYNTSTANLHNFQVAGTTFLEVGSSNGAAPFSSSAFLRFSQTASSPVIGQTALSSGSGATFTVQAQSTSAASQTGGILQLASGRGSGGSGFDGTVDILTGTPTGGGTLKMRIHPTTAPVSANNSTIEIFENNLRFDDLQVLPFILQETTAGATGTHLTVQAQNASTTGGNLLLSSGTGAGTAGNVIIKTGNTNQIIVTPTLTTILGNLLVNGTTTSVASTVVEIADRVINLNSSANQFPGTTVPAPTQITGFAIDRGSSNNTTKRDYFGLFWSETDGYWRFAVNTDGYTTQNTLFSTLPVLASAYMAQPSAAVPVSASAIPTVGGFRALNNTTVVAARNAAGTQDLPLVGTDSTNHLLWGSPTNNAGTIFNTTVGTDYDFQVNSVSAYKLTLSTSGTSTLEAAAGTTSLVYRQANTGGGTGANTTLQAQNAATTGGNLVLTSGTGTTAGNVQLQTGAVDKVVVHPTFTEFRDTAEAMRVTPVSAGTSQITFASTVTAVSINQTALVGTTGASWTVQAQNATTTGGNITLSAGNATTTGGNAIITSGTGATAGDTKLQTGGVDRVIVHASFTEFRDTAEAYRITPLSAGTTTLQAASTVTLVQYRQADLTSNGGTGAATILQAQNETGTTSTGGALILTSGTGTTTAGNLQLQTGAVDRVVVHPTFTEFRDTAEAYRITPVSAGATTLQAASTVTAVTYKQADLTTNSGTGATTTLQAQNETGTTSTGGGLVLVAGSGTSLGGNASLTAGSSTTTGGAATLAGGAGTTTGGNALVTSGTGATAGNVQLQTGAVDRVVVHPTFTEFRDTAEAVRVTPVSAGTTQVLFASTVTAVTIKQTDLTTNSGTGATTTVQAQNETGTTSNGGDLNLTSGTGTSLDGYVNLQAGGSTVVKVHTNKVTFVKGWRRHVTSVTGTYQVLVTDDYLAITTLAAPFTITMPANPVSGDTYQIKDTTGNAATSNVTIAGNGNNIDGAASFVLTSAYASVTLTYTGTQWSIS